MIAINSDPHTPAESLVASLISGLTKMPVK